MNNQNIQQLLTQFFPLQQFGQLVGQALPWFMGVAIFILWVAMQLQAVTNDPLVVIQRGTIAAACMVLSPLFLFYAEQTVEGLVHAIGNIAPQLNWLIVNNPGNGALIMDFTKPFSVLGKYVGGSFVQANNAAVWDVAKQFEYGVRTFLISVAGGFAAFTVFIMEIMLIIQKLVMIGSSLLMPLMIACLLLPSGHGSAINFIKNLIGVVCWPVSWAIIHIATMALLQTMHSPSWTAPLGELALSVGYLVFVCLMLLAATLSGPIYFHRFVVRGENFAQHLVGDMAGAAGKHISHGAESAGKVTGGAVGAIGGPAGVALGASIGGGFGGATAAPFASATDAAQGINSGRRAIPSSRSNAAANGVLEQIRARA